MLDRRRFTFGMLLGVGAAGSAFAGTPAQNEVAAGPGLAGRFVAAQPRYAGLRSELAAFFQQSRREFFSGSAAAADEARWGIERCREFCRQCRDAERGAA